MTRSLNTVDTLARRRFKRRQQKQCEHCGWSPPQLPTSASPLNVHHIVPVRWGGTHEAGNLILLCPNHHAIADCLHLLWRRRASNGAAPYSIATRESLLKALALADADPEGWLDALPPTFGEEDLTAASHPTPQNIPYADPKRAAQPGESA